MEKKYLFLLLLLLTVGFASVNTYLDLNGKVDMSLLESDLDVVFKEVLLNKEKSENTIIIENGKSFIYSADELTSENKTSTLDYVVMNRSHQYDVEVTVSCTSDYETYLNYNGTFANQTLPLEKGILIEAGEVKSGNIITELIKTNTSEESLVLKCTLNYIPVSRETVVEDEEYLVTLDSGYEEKLGDIKVKYYEEYNKLPELTRSNYKFLGWYTEDDIKVDNNSLVKIKGSHTLKAKWQKICEYDPGKEWTFDYTGSEQEFSVPCDGNYKLETWGAQGGNANSTYIGGYGASAIGVINSTKNEKIYINVGGQGLLAHSPDTANGGYNGGGIGYSVDSRPHVQQALYMGSGGGATHMATISGLLSDLEKYKGNLVDDSYYVSDKILIVAAGGGGADMYTYANNYHNGIAAGGNHGNQMIYTENGRVIKTESGSQIKAGHMTDTENNFDCSGDFGQGCSCKKPSWSAGGGGGFYGGGSGYGSATSGGGGGSSYIASSRLISTFEVNKAMYCYNCTESSEESTKTISTTCTSATPTTNCAKQGNGYAKITYLGN